MIEEKQGIATDRACKDLVHAGHFTMNRAPENPGHFLDWMRLHLGHTEQNAITGQFRKGTGGPGVTDVDELCEGVCLCCCQFHAEPSVKMDETSCKTFSLLNGLVM